MVISQQEIIESLKDSSTELVNNLMSLFYTFSRLRTSDLTQKVREEYDEQIEKMREQIKSYEERVKE